jgi:hypothetical protein
VKSDLINIEEKLHALVKADVAHFIKHMHVIKDDRENIMAWRSAQVAMRTWYNIHI